VTANSFHKRPGGAAPIGLVAPVLTAAQHGGSVRGADEPMRTIAASDKDQHAIIAPTLVQTGYGEREGQAPRALDIGKPLGTVVAGGAKQAVVAAHLSRQFGASVGQDVGAPAPTTTEVNKTAVVAAFLAQHNNDSRRIGGVNPGQPADRPVSTITATGSQQGVVAAHLQNMRGSDRRDGAADEPARTVSAGGTHAALVAAFMTKYYGEGGMDQTMVDPLHTITAKARMGLVTVEVAGEPYVITDIGLRMLTPRELFLAQGFPPEYQIDGIVLDGRVLTKSDQISCVGNSVCPPLAAALVATNCAHLSAIPAMEAAE
jgi:DNA (cytosine-5)-methyltransferase 1